MKRKFIKELVEAHLLQEKSIAKQKHPFKAILMTGPAGAGKTFTAKNLLGIPAYVRQFNINPDDIIEDLFPKFDVSLKFAHGKEDPLAAAQAELRKIAKVGTHSKATGFINRAKPLFIDTTGDDVNKLTKVLDELVELGYDVGIIKVFVPKETSVRRDVGRKRTVGAPTLDIWDDYKKNVIDGKGYDKYAEGKPNVKVLNADPFWNVYNLGEKDVVIDDKLIAKGRSKVADVAGDVPVSIEEMDRVIADLKKATAEFLEPYDIPNPIGKNLYEGMLALMQFSNGKLGQEITDLYAAGIDYPELVERSPELSIAIATLGEITGTSNLEDSFKKFQKIVSKAARAKEKDLSAPFASDVVAQLKQDRRQDQLAEVIAKRLVKKLKK
tara:strand:- start:998 stop:2146 length:1149 start_codon:yes stop_codon:yes gene_type:complete